MKQTKMENLGVNQRRFLKFIMLRKQNVINKYEMERVRSAIDNGEYRTSHDDIMFNDIRQRFKDEFYYWTRVI